MKQLIRVRLSGLRLKAHGIIMKYLMDRYSFDRELASNEAMKKVMYVNEKELKTLISAYS